MAKARSFPRPGRPGSRTSPDLARFAGSTGVILARWKLIYLTQFLDSAFVAALTGYALLHFKHQAANSLFVTILGAVVLAAILKYSFFSASLYETSALLDIRRSLRALAPRWTVTTIAIGLVISLFSTIDRGGLFWFARFYAAGLLGFGAQRLVIATAFRHGVDRGHSTQTIAILGANPLSEQLVAHFENNPHGVKFVGVFDDRNRDDVRDVGGIPKLGGLNDLIDYARDQRVDFVVVTLPTTATERLAFVRERFRQLPLNVGILASSLGLEEKPLRPTGQFELPGVQLLTVQNRPISEPALLVKGTIDRLLAGLGLVLIAPVLLACAAGIALSSPGPVLFQQKRIGFKGKEFSIYKFRTMHASDRPQTRLTERGDPRIFKFGQILRKLSLDELPQLFNVLRGEMSLIGPRPHMPEARAAGELYFEAVRAYADRHRVLPGITGWAQVNGWRGPTETLEQLSRRVEFDVYYIENWSLGLDFAIFIKTISVGFFGKNAF